MRNRSALKGAYPDLLGSILPLSVTLVLSTAFETCSMEYCFVWLMLRVTTASATLSKVTSLLFSHNKHFRRFITTVLRFNNRKQFSKLHNSINENAIISVKLRFIDTSESFNIASIKMHKKCIQLPSHTYPVVIVYLIFLNFFRFRVTGFSWIPISYMDIT